MSDPLISSFSETAHCIHLHFVYIWSLSRIGIRMSHRGTWERVNVPANVRTRERTCERANVGREHANLVCDCANFYFYSESLLQCRIVRRVTNNFTTSTTKYPTKISNSYGRRFINFSRKRRFFIRETHRVSISLDRSS